MITKIYQAVNCIRLITQIDVNGTPGVIEFNGGHYHPTCKTGTFTTNNPMLQKAIENDPDFNKEFVLISAIVKGENSKEITTKKEPLKKRKNDTGKNNR